jgi:hypothetical protein
MEKKFGDSEQLYSRETRPLSRNSRGEKSRPKIFMPISVAVAARRSFLLLRTRPGVGETPGRSASDIDVKVIAK